MPRMYAITMLLFLVFYIYAVLFTQLFGDMTLSGNYFGSLDVSLFTCMQLMTLEWADLSREIMSEKTWAWAPLLSFIMITGFIVFNLIVAVVCDAVAVTEQQFKAEREALGAEETDTDRLVFAQERISELALQVESMKVQTVAMHEVVHALAEELQTSLLLIQQLQTPATSSSVLDLTSAADHQPPPSVKFDAVETSHEQDDD
jgi:Ion transport protein